MEDDKPDAQTPTPKRWWQWMLVYPTFIIALIGAVPTFTELYESQSKDVEFGDSKIAEMRNEMWRKNMTCGMAPLDPLINEFNVAVDATICKSGDVLVRVITPNQKQFFEWVSVDAMFPDRLAGINLFSSAVASEVAHTSVDQPNNSLDGEIFAQHYGPVVLCQNWINNVMLVRRVSYPNQGCFYETINTFTGQVVNVTPAPCYC